MSSQPTPLALNDVDTKEHLQSFVGKLSSATALLDSQFKATGLEETLNDCLLLTEELNTIADLVEGDSAGSNKVSSSRDYSLLHF